MAISSSAANSADKQMINTLPLPYRGLINDNLTRHNLVHIFWLLHSFTCGRLAQINNWILYKKI